MEQNSIKLRRDLNWIQGVALTIGAVLGSGVLVLPVLAAQLAGPASLVSWLVMGLLTMPVVITLGNLASRWPDAGGIAAYAQRAFGRRAGTVTGWLFLGTVPIGAPVVALIGSGYIGAFFSFTRMEMILMAIFMLAMAIFLNYRGINLSGKVQLLVVSIIALILLFIIFSAFPEVRTEAFFPFTPHGLVPIGVVMTILFWAYVGWEMIGHLAEEFENPARDIKLCLGISLVIINLLYISLAFVIVGTGAYLGDNKIAALAAMVFQNWGNKAGTVVSFLGFIVCYGTLHTYVAGFSRLVYAQSRQGDFPSFLTKLHPVYQTPYHVLWILGLVFIFVLLVMSFFSLDLTVLIQFTSAVFIALYIIGMASAVKLFDKASSSRRYAIISLTVCLIVYGFTSWSGLYPIILGTVGWYAGYRNSSHTVD